VVFFPQYFLPGDFSSALGDLFFCSVPGIILSILLSRMIFRFGPCGQHVGNRADHLPIPGFLLTANHPKLGSLRGGLFVVSFSSGA
jgi:hypothetical protein